MSEILKKSDFYYDLPEELIAQNPLEDRSSSRLLVLNKETGAVEHRHFTDIKEYLRPGDCLVINDTKVIPARLIGTKTGDAKGDGNQFGSKIEVLLLKRGQDDVWETIVRPGKKARTGFFPSPRSAIRVFPRRPSLFFTTLSAMRRISALER